LLDEGLVRSSAPRGRSAPEQTEIDPESPAREVAGGDAVETDDGGEADAPAADASTRDGPSATESEMPNADADDRGDEATRTRAHGVTGSTGTDESTTESTETRGDPSTADVSGTGLDERESDDVAAASEDAAGDDDRSAGSVVEPTDQRTLDGEAAMPEGAYDRLPAMRVLGQFDETYVVAETPDGLVLIDQHAADERINYERLRAEMSGETPTQALAEPVELELTAREGELFATYRDALAELGFHADRVDDRTVEVRTVPTVFDTALDPSLLRDALTGFADGSAGETVDAVADGLLADLACYPSITGNTSLTEGSVVDLLDALDDCENPFACPHGRPVVVAFDRDEIEDRFERDYPGHGGRRAE
jgi:DNA mismatch repair protein MutL